VDIIQKYGNDLATYQGRIHRWCIGANAWKRSFK